MSYPKRNGIADGDDVSI